jgi:hypothetical protein
MNAPDATLTNGRYELPPSARGVLFLAEPPERGWRMRTPSDEQHAAEWEPPSAPRRGCDRQRTSESASA